MSDPAVPAATAGPPEGKAKPDRIAWIDYARGIAIVLVVIGHVLPGLINDQIAPHTTWSSFVFNWIYAFHMPLFFALSGIFALGTAARPWPQFCREKFQGIVYPYLVWATIQTLLMVLLADFTNHTFTYRDLLQILIAPPAQFWFIYTVFFLMVVHALLLRVGVGPWLFLALSVVAYILADRIYLGSWRVPYAVQKSAIYFAAGVVFSAAGGRVYLASLSNALLAALTLAGGALVTIAVVLLLPNDRAMVIAFNPALDLVVAVAGSLAVLTLSVLLSRLQWGAFLPACGRRTLEIYVTHTIASAGTRVVLQKVFGLESVALHLIAGIVAGIAAPMALVWLSERYGFHWIFTLRNRKKANDIRQVPA